MQIEIRVIEDGDIETAVVHKSTVLNVADLETAETIYNSLIEAC